MPHIIFRTAKVTRSSVCSSCFRLSNAQTRIKCKDDIIGKLQVEMRRFRSEEVSSKPAPAEPVQSSDTDERVISSHGGIIDRYIGQDAENHKLQKELKKTQDRLEDREYELHRAKVALAGRSSPAFSTSSSPLVPAEGVSVDVGAGEGSLMPGGPRQSLASDNNTPATRPSKRMYWTKNEEEDFYKAVQHLGVGRWMQIKSQLQTNRTRRQYNQLSQKFGPANQ
ncbi:uncharacterized protein [Littorina saxatilis]|uniref:uncharacterized protein n=1 Tax=Littorina saxatilis TaxID=31220 RepID=UPI0038B5AB9E